MGDEIFLYNWFEENIPNFLSRYNLPAYYDGNNLLDFIAQYKNKFLSDFDDILLNGSIRVYPDKMYGELAEQKKVIIKIFDSIIDAVKAVEASCLARAESIIDDLFKNIENDFHVTNINYTDRYNPTLFRVRSSIDKSEQDITPMDLFHVPISKRYVLGNERFSLPGQPCLYLSTSLNIAWKECGMPLTFYYSQYNYDYKKDELNPWKFLALIAPNKFEESFISPERYINNPARWENFYKYLRTFPVIFACSIISLHKEMPYKQEYVFPQLVMQWIHRHIDRIKGILYFSCVGNKGFRQANGYDIAIPATDFNDDGYSKVLLDRFTIAKPIYADNKISVDIKRKYKELFDRIRCFRCVEHEMSDCLDRLYQLVYSICVLIEDIGNIKSTVALVLVENINLNIGAFFDTFPINKVIDNCKQSETHQKRYDEQLTIFQGIYNDFRELKLELDKYFLRLEHWNG